MIPYKLVKMSTSAWWQPLSYAIKNSLTNGTFPDNAKFAVVWSLDKDTSENNDILNFRLGSILTMFSKIYERVTKKVTDRAMNKYLSHFISAFRHNQSIRHVLIRLLEEWRGSLDNNFIVGGGFLDLSKVLDYILLDLLMAKLEAYGYDDCLVHYFYSYSDNRKQFVHTNNEKGSSQNKIPGVTAYNMREYGFFINPYSPV